MIFDYGESMIKKILSTPKAVVVVIAAILTLIGVIITGLVSIYTTKLPIKYTQTAQASQPLFSTPTLELPGNSITVGEDNSGIIVQGDNNVINPPATSVPSPTMALTPTITPTPVLFSVPTIESVITGYDLPGYSKQNTIVRSSQGILTLFIRNGDGDLGYIKSQDGGKTWNTFTVFDTITPPGAPQISAVIDSADQIHVVWGRAPDAGNANYGLLDNDTWIMTDIVGTGVYARDIAVDSSNHPHIIWTNVDLFHTTYTGQEWTDPEKIVRGAWHPDIQVNSKDDLFLLMNDGAFYPTQGVSAWVMDNTGGEWNNPVKISDSPFWSGGVAGAIDSQNDIYVVWIGSSTKDGGKDEVFFSRNVSGQWQTPFPIGELNSSAGSVGQESPAIAFDSNDVLYVFWRGLNEKNRPVIFARALATENSRVSKVTWGWSPIIELDIPTAADVWWPSIADMNRNNRSVGVDLVWQANIGKDSVIQFAHIVYP